MEGRRKIIYDLLLIILKQNIFMKVHACAWRHGFARIIIISTDLNRSLDSKNAN